jgi:hypothetical protein
VINHELCSIFFFFFFFFFFFSIFSLGSARRKDGGKLTPAHHLAALATPQNRGLALGYAALFAVCILWPWVGLSTSSGRTATPRQHVAPAEQLGTVTFDAGAPDGPAAPRTAEAVKFDRHGWPVRTGSDGDGGACVLESAIFWGGLGCVAFESKLV